MRGLIAEIGNHHFGSLQRAKQLIYSARECGAHYVKMQAIDTMEFKGGSMPPDFYRQCDLGMAGYMECIEYAKDIGIPLFFSVFGSKYLDLIEHYPEMPYKISGYQFHHFDIAALEYWNNERSRPVVASIPHTNEQELINKCDATSNMHLMIVNDYLDVYADFKYMRYCSEVFKKPIGFSDHTMGLQNCFRAVIQHGAQLVEKHFNIFGDQYFGGKIYRDSIHAANPMELERLAKLLQGSAT